MKKMDWMVAAGTAAGLAGVLYSAGCERTAGDCALLGTCGEGGGTSSSSASSTTASSTTASSTTASSTASSTSSSGTGGTPASTACEGKRFGDIDNQRARTISADTAGGVLIAGDFQGTLPFGGKSVTAVGDDIFVAGVDANWNATSLTRFAVPYGAVVSDLKGGFILAGPYTLTADLGCVPVLDGTTNLYIARLDSKGACTWAKGFIAPSAHVSLAVAASGHIALAGDAQGPMDFDLAAAGTLPITNGGGGRDLFLVELDADGTVLSKIGYGGSGDEVANAVAFDAAGGTVLTGTFKSPTLDFGTGSASLKNPTGKELAFVARTGGGAASWFVGFAGMGEQRATALAVDAGVVLVAGAFNDSLGMLKATDEDFFLLSLSGADGSVKWSKHFAGTGVKVIKSIATSALAGGTVALAGSLDGDVDFGLGKLANKQVVATFAASDGVVRSSRDFGVADPMLSVGGVCFQGGNLYVAGGFSGMLDLGDMVTVSSNGAADVFVAKFCLP